MSTIYTYNWSDLPPPKNTKVADIINSLPCKYMAWMEGSEWPLYMTFIDRMSDTRPTHITSTPDFTASNLNLGAGVQNYQQVPKGPTETFNASN